ncbi:D-alanyl-lipoteichoic acid biosynthesis protein DltB [Eggerthella lenta]|uniref:D-alanyl-lipoteichoic acid biosynthesis protein DltB n=1 Tax=Eggerthella lenta TaxID=84112 RepID=UPI00232F0FE4|nr:D-alanyl-lipoteichoic acid biosynthesis protein DltB [Eggerthella lenta]MDB1802499.1 D-alanyl-lipoteichoic acid biosynthesis protein DltB [Eggerthella lenta]
MSFYTSPSFFVLLAISIIPAAVLGFTGRRIRPYGMAATIVFVALLFSDDVKQLAMFGVFLLIATSAAFLTQRSWTKGKKSLALYRMCLAATIAPLVVYKISGLLDSSLLGFIGISYVTFKAVQVIIEIRDGLITKMAFSDFLYFISFFPVLTSGPIDRSRRFMEDANKRYSKSEYADLLSRGILLLLIGAVYQMVIATVCSQFFDFHTFRESKTLLFNIAAAGKDAWAYGFFLFFNFAGYSMMAMGASYCFGIKTPRNFRAPFASLDIKDFWNRWNMTLSFWLRDFVFMRFVRSVSKHKPIKDRLTSACFGYLIDMTLMGAWHGLTIDFLLYGVYHGALLAITDVFQKKSSFYKRYKNEIWFKAVSWMITINLIMLGFSLFSGQATLIVKGLL